MNFAFHPQAEAEFNDAIEYYEEIEPGLGYILSQGTYPGCLPVCRG